VRCDFCGPVSEDDIPLCQYCRRPLTEVPEPAKSAEELMDSILDAAGVARGTPDETLAAIKRYGREQQAKAFDKAYRHYPKAHWLRDQAAKIRRNDDD